MAQTGSSAALASAAGGAGQAATASSKRIIRGIVYDMDGTLTVPVIDFALMRCEVLGLPDHRVFPSSMPSLSQWPTSILHQQPFSVHSRMWISAQGKPIPT